MLNVENREAVRIGRLTELVSELLDAHLDTIQLTGEDPEAEVIAAHLDYLRSLQRVGRETLAHLAAPL